MNNSILSSLSSSSPAGFGAFTKRFVQLGGGLVAPSPSPDSSKLEELLASIKEKHSGGKQYSFWLCFGLCMAMLTFSIIGVISAVAWGGYGNGIEDTLGCGSTVDECAANFKDEKDKDNGRYTSGVLAVVFMLLAILIGTGLIMYLWFKVPSAQSQ